MTIKNKAQKDLFTSEEIKWLLLLLGCNRRNDLSSPIMEKLLKLKNDMSRM